MRTKLPSLSHRVVGRQTRFLILVKVDGKKTDLVVPALALLGGGGVIGNIARFFDSGLENYASVPACTIAVAINAYDTALNIIAALGLFKSN